MSVEAEVYGTVGFVVVALGLSLFYGLKATKVFGVPDAGQSLPWKFHQFWLNFMGSIVGWMAVWFVKATVARSLERFDPVRFNLPTVLLCVVAFVGITGYLPLTVVNLVNSVGALVGKIAGLPAPASDKDRTK